MCEHILKTTFLIFDFQSLLFKECGEFQLIDISVVTLKFDGDQCSCFENRSELLNSYKTLYVLFSGELWRLSKTSKKIF